MVHPAGGGLHRVVHVGHVSIALDSSQLTEHDGNNETLHPANAHTGGAHTGSQTAEHTGELHNQVQLGVWATAAEINRISRIIRFSSDLIVLPIHSLLVE